MIPCAEKARFLKTGGEAAAACIKVARNATGRSKIAQCGYNGWLNRLSRSTSGPQPVAMRGASPEEGTPEELARLHVSLPWGDIDAWENEFAKHGRDIAAAVIASDYANIEKGADFLPDVRRLTQKHGALMVMDEIVTGFRIAVGGVHQYFDFRPDMAVFAKGLANGMPLSTYLGRADLLDSAVDLRISSTFGGETLSLAASKATLGFYKERDVVGHMWRMGKLFMDGVNRLFEDKSMEPRLAGFPACAMFRFPDDDTREAFFRRCYAEGVSLYDAVYISYSHSESDIQEALSRIEKAIERPAGGA
jgi:glutamate-1-semialdehyde 2,1-aminomutase